MFGMSRPLLLFLLLAFGFSWSLAALAHLAGLAYDGSAGMAIGALFMIGPALAAIVVRLRVEQQPLFTLGLTLRGTNWRWMAITALIGLSFAPLTLLYNHVLGSVLHWEGFGRTAITMDMLQANLASIMEQRGMPLNEGLMGQLAERGITAPVFLVIVLLGGLFAALTVNAPFMFGEEFGWRGFMHHHTRAWGFGRQVLATGLCWGLWHAPLILQGHNYPGYPMIGVGMMTLFTLAVSISFAWVRIRTRSVWGPVLLHGIINGTAGVTLFFTEGTHVLLGSIAGVSGILAILTVTALIILLDPGTRNGIAPVEQ
jgi:uncharacterized protein